MLEGKPLRPTEEPLETGDNRPIAFECRGNPAKAVAPFRGWHASTRALVTGRRPRSFSAKWWRSLGVPVKCVCTSMRSRSLTTSSGGLSSGSAYLFSSSVA